MTIYIRRLSALAIAVALMSPHLCRSQQAVAASETRGNARTLDDLLSRPVTIEVTRVSLKRAIDVLSERAGVAFQYKDHTIEAYTAPVTVHLVNVPLRTAIERVLFGTSLVVVLDGTKRLAIIDAVGAARAAGIVTGLVTNGKTKQPMSGVNVWLDDSSHATRTDEDGRYHFATVPAGAHRIVVRSIGYARQVRMISITDGQTLTVDFTLESSVNTLDQVVVTATGAQRVRELGHIVTRINVDSLVKEAPITSVIDLLTARVPGLVVLTGNGGTAGAAASLQLRGNTSLLLNSDPIVIVDGVRFRSSSAVDNGARGVGDTRTFGHGDLPTPLNDLNPNDIETIEVAKGPSASALYGPDAANGVIVITTKHPQAGKTQFNWYARPVTNDVPEDRLPRFRYVAWGHTPNTNDVSPYGNCTLILQYYQHVCILDSITTVSTQFTNSDFSVLAKHRPTWQYGANLTGGSAALRYFVSGNYDSEVGVIRLSPAADSILTARYGLSSIAGAVRTPNTYQALSTHTSVVADVSPTMTLGISANYTQSANQRVDVSGVFGNQVENGPQAGADTTSSLYLPPVDFSIYTTSEQSSRLNTAINGVDQLFPWLTLNATVGIDLEGVVTHAVRPGNALGGTFDDYSQAQDDRRSNTGRTMTLGATSALHPGALSFRTSLGVQYSYTHVDGVNSIGYTLAPGSSSIGTASAYGTSPVWSEMVQLGTYGEEVLGLRDRIFLTGSLRFDGSTTFGDAYHPTPNPKVGVSWIVSDEPLLRQLPGIQELRLRYSAGTADRYPTSEMKLGSLAPGSYTFNEGSQNVFFRTVLANPNLRPERTRETEAGLDATVLSGVTASLTWYTRRTDDQLHRVSNPTGLQELFANTSSIKAHGFEFTVNIPVVNTEWIRGDLGATYSYNTNRVVQLGSVSDLSPWNLGYPLGAIFGQRILGVLDTVGTGAGNAPDGIIFPQEVVRDTAFTFLGVTVPPRTYTVTPSVTLLQGRLRVSSLFDRSTGYIVSDFYEGRCQYTGLCLAPFLTTTPLLVQAKYANSPNPTDFFEPGDNTRWRELNVTFDLPNRLLHWDVLHLQFSRASFSLQGRNLKLWTKYSGPDPDSRDQGLFAEFAGGIPQARAWSFRFDITP